jgi:hypothetical protein
MRSRSTLDRGPIAHGGGGGVGARIAAWCPYSHETRWVLSAGRTRGSRPPDPPISRGMCQVVHLTRTRWSGIPAGVWREVILLFRVGARPVSSDAPTDPLVRVELRPRNAPPSHLWERPSDPAAKLDLRAGQPSPPTRGRSEGLCAPELVLGTLAAAGIDEHLHVPVRTDEPHLEPNSARRFVRGDPTRRPDVDECVSTRIDASDERMGSQGWRRRQDQGDPHQDRRGPPDDRCSAHRPTAWHRRCDRSNRPFPRSPTDTSRTITPRRPSSRGE